VRISGRMALAGIVMATCLLTPVMAVDLHAQVAP
jgi:hypothetical protein